MALISSAWTTRAQDTLLDSLSLQPSAWAPSKISDTPVQFQLRYYMDAAGWNGRPIGLWSDGTTMYVTDWLFSKLFAYNIAGPRDYAGDINSLAPAGNRTTRGVWSDGTIIWVCDDFEDRIFAYKLQSGERQEDREFDTLAAAGNDTPAGLWSDGSTMWVTDDKDEKIYAYDLVTTFRKPQLDFGSPFGCWKP
jgi:sugar lactone lactonase YvrE